MSSSLGLGMTVRATDEASNVFARVGNNLDKLYADANGRMRDSRGKFVAGGGAAAKGFGEGFTKGSAGVTSSVGGIVSQLGGLIGGGAIVGAFGKVIGSANDFTESLHKLKAISGATEPQMKALEKAAMDAGIATQFNPTQASDALGDLASAGFNVSESMKMLNPTLNLAAASLGQLTPSDAAGLASSTMKAFSLNIDEASDTTDKLVQTMNVFAVEAKDLPLGIAGISRGAGAMKQSLDESLISFGLVRNIMPRVESAATAVSTAMERMVDPKVQQQLKGLGVQVTDSAGKFRPFLDVVGDMIPQLDKMTDAKKAQFLQHTFGAEALGGFNAIMGQVTKGIQTNTGSIVKGTDALAYLREQFKNSKGTAKQFADEMLKDLPGQMKLLKGSLETLSIAIGKPMANVLAPMVEGVVDGVNKVLNFFQALPDGMKDTIARVALVLGGLTAVFLFAGGPVTIAIAAIGGAILGLKALIDGNVGGMGDKWAAMTHTIGLAWDGVGQLLSQGGFSGKVRSELNNAENSGLKSFLITVYVWGNRIKHFVEGIGDGFKAGFGKAQPAFDALGESLSKLGEALGLTSKNDPTKNKGAWEAWGATGAKVGNGIAVAMGFVADVLNIVVGAAIGIVDMWDRIKGATAPLTGATDSLSDSFGTLSRAFGGADPSAHMSGWEALGKVLGEIAAVITGTLSTAIASAADGLAGFVTTFAGVVDLVKGIASGDWSQIWLGMKEVVYGMIKSINSFMQGMVLQIAGAIDALGKLAGEDIGAKVKMQKIFDDQDKALRDEMGIKGEAPTEVRAGASRVSQLIGRQHEGVMGTTGTVLPSVALAAQAGAGFGGLAAQGLAGGIRVSRPIQVGGPTVHVMIDGQQVAAHVTSIQKENRHRGGGDDAPADE